MTTKTRVDTALVARGFFPSREKAQAAIMAGEVYIGEKKVSKASEAVCEDDTLNVRAPKTVYVSRGALKLEKAVHVFGADLSGKTVLDIGASTGGFTDVCLRNGAVKVYAVDVGYGQLDWKLRNDPRVVVMERTNARYLKPEQFTEKPEVTVMDVSFISIKLILPVAAEIMGEGGVFYTLIKPQFEAGREKVGKNGVVRDPETHENVINNIIAFSESIGWHVHGLDYSPITGPEGNIEFLAEIRKEQIKDGGIDAAAVRRIVAEAHGQLIHSA